MYSVIKCYSVNVVFVMIFILISYKLLFNSRMHMKESDSV